MTSGANGALRAQHGEDAQLAARFGNKRGGYYVLIGGSGRLADIFSDLVRGLWASITGRAKVRLGVARAVPADLSLLKGLIEAGKLRTVIERRYSLDEIAAAHRHAEGGHKKGHVVILLP